MDRDILDALRVAQAKLEDEDAYDIEKALRFLKLIDKIPPLEKRLRQPLEDLLENPPKEDTSLIVIYETNLVKGEIVAAGTDTLKNMPLTRLQPIHFKKTLLGKSQEESERTKEEMEKSLEIWASTRKEQSRLPMPLSASKNQFRSELIMGKALLTLSPVPWKETAESKEQYNAIKSIIAKKKEFPASSPEQKEIKTHWDRLESAHECCKQLHGKGWLHHDLHLQNILVETETNQGFLIDFETSEPSEFFPGKNPNPEDLKAWEETKAADLRYPIIEGYLTQQISQEKFKGEFADLCRKYGPVLTPGYLKQIFQETKLPSKSKIGPEMS